MDHGPYQENTGTDNTREVLLPPPKTAGRISVEEVLQARRSVRDFSSPALNLEDVGQLLWAAQGVTHPEGRRTAPSAGPTYPLELALVAGRVEGLEPGAFRYLPRDHALSLLQPGDLRTPLVQASLKQEWMLGAGAIVVFAAVYQRTERRYGRRAVQYVHMEAGHAVQNLHLQAVALGLGTTVVGAFQEERVRALLRLEADEVPLAMMPVGRR